MCHRYLITKVTQMGANLWLGDKRMSTKVSITLGIRYFLVWLNQNGDRFDMGNGGRVTIACLSQTIRSSQIALLLHMRLFFTGAT